MIRKLLCMIGLLVLLGASNPIGVGTDTIVSFGGAVTSEPITVGQTPTPGNMIVVAAIFGVANNSPVAPSGFTLQCSNTTNNGYVWTHLVASGDTSSYGNATWTASSGILVVGERNSMNTTVPIFTSGGICPMTSNVGTVNSPSVPLGTPMYRNSLPEALFESPALSRCTGTNTCNQSGWIELTYRNTSIFGESQASSSVAPQTGSTALINFTSTGSGATKSMGWYDNPTVLSVYSICNGSMMRGFVGC